MTKSMKNQMQLNIYFRTVLTYVQFYRNVIKLIGKNYLFSKRNVSKRLFLIFFQLVQNMREIITSDVFHPSTAVATRSAIGKRASIYLLYKLQLAEHVFITSGK